MKDRLKLIRTEYKYDLRNKFSYFIVLRITTFFIFCVPVSVSQSGASQKSCQGRAERCCRNNI